MMLTSQQLKEAFNGIGSKGMGSKYMQPSNKESSIEIKQNMNKLDTEKENMIKKLESFKVMKTLYVMNNDLDHPIVPNSDFSSVVENIRCSTCGDLRPIAVVACYCSVRSDSSGNSPNWL